MRIARFFARLNTAKERLKRAIHTMQHVVKHVRVDMRQRGRSALQCGQTGGLARKAYRLAALLIGGLALTERKIIEMTAGLYRLSQDTILCRRRTQFVDERLQSRVRCASIYRRSVSDETFPAVLMKELLVQSDGMRRKSGNSSRKMRLDVPFSRAMIWLGAQCGSLLQTHGGGRARFQAPVARTPTRVQSHGCVLRAVF